MTGMWIITTGFILCILITWTRASPLPQNTGGDGESEETESEEDESTLTTTTQRAIQNATDLELTNKATQFLTRYFSNYGTEAPLHIPTNLNHTIVITIVPNNASANAYENLEGPPTFGGDIPLYPSQQQQQLALLQSQGIVPLTPAQNLFGFVRQEQLSNLKQQQQQFHEATVQPQLAPSSLTPPTPQLSSTTTTITTTTTTASPRTAAPVTDLPVDNIEDAILEALSIAEIGQGQATQSTQDISNIDALIQSGVIPGLTNNNNGAIHVPSNFGPVFIQAGEQSTGVSGGTAFINQNTPVPPVAAVAAPPSLPNIIYLQQLLPPTNNAEEIERQRPAAQGAHAINAVSGIIGSISQGNLGGVVQNSIKLAETPVIQNTAKLATVAILHNVLQGLNPCNFLGNCRPALKKND